MTKLEMSLLLLKNNNDNIIIFSKALHKARWLPCFHKPLLYHAGIHSNKVFQQNSV